MRLGCAQDAVWRRRWGGARMSDVAWGARVGESLQLYNSEVQLYDLSTSYQRATSPTALTSAVRMSVPTLRSYFGNIS